MEKRVELPLERKDKEDKKGYETDNAWRTKTRYDFVFLFVIIKLVIKDKCISPFSEW